MTEFLKQRQKMLDEARISQGIDASDRRTGKSTGMALGFIGQCLMAPETPVRIYDHNPKADDHIMTLCWDLIDKLKLQGFWGNKSKKLLVYSLNPEPFRDWSKK